MLRTLLKMRFRSLIASLLAGSKKRRTIPLMIVFSLLLLFVAFSFLSLFFSVFLLVGLPLFERGADATFLALGLLVSLFVMLVSSVVYTKNQLYVAGDNELLLAMPIPPRLILTTRLILLLAVNYLLSALVALPMLLVWLLFGRVTVGALLSLLLVLLLLPVAALALTSLLAWLLARIAARIRSRSLLVTFFALLALGAYFVFIFAFDGILEGLSEDVTPLVEFVAAVPPLATLGRAAMGSPLELLLFVLIALAFSAAVFFWLSRTYLKTVLENRGGRRIAYRERKTAAKSPLLALTGRELRHLVSSPTYMLNVAPGLIFTLAVPLFFLIEGGLVSALTSLGEPIARLLPPAALLITAATVSMSYFSAVTVSLEGRTLWILRSSPVPTATALASKVLFHLVPTAPVVLVASLLYAVALGTDPVSALMLIIASLAFCLFSALFGLTVNLLLPKLDWKNEAVPIKQGGASAIAMFGGTLAGSIFGGIAVAFSLLLPAAVALLLSTLVMLAASFGLAAFIFKGGVKMFEQLS